MKLSQFEYRNLPAAERAHLLALFAAYLVPLSPEVVAHLAYTFERA